MQIVGVDALRARDLDGDGDLDLLSASQLDDKIAWYENEADGVGEACDNCPGRFNPGQEDDDGDAAGSVCDNCPALANVGQADLDRDDAGDACDCAVDDPTARPPAEVNGLVIARDGAASVLGWSAVPGADRYMLDRGGLRWDGVLCIGDACLTVSRTQTTYRETEVPAAGEGFGYLVVGVSDACARSPWAPEPARIKTTESSPGPAPRSADLRAVRPSRDRQRPSPAR